ncbi:MAG TPA: hypothetical protein PLE99_09260 [Candidatus Thiothrix moscowensis]|uniref:hypothetical protein n=1 Tax=unclassified Thiothrix TaxID=2636184 RepID=UPI001A1CE0E0|nr:MULTISPECIES: hypothetical protein [unclassified Thiothrix]MBJ6611130.1 hypothetical protein [Candidatus Thiothrix moscowensis]HRJ52945.1 hypothetical protein [Candidatus Thiothrix moscowensis]HRJ93011.1 hypothetical protein [Candidatus Thiothrix moscowensis]
MLPGLPPQSGSAEEKRLRKLYRELNPQDQASLLRFAEFLAASSSNPVEPMTVFPEPEAIERPQQESVVKAIKRLTATYPMIERDRLLNETSSLMTAHVIHGKTASAVIDELEAMFERHYLELKANFEERNPF